MTRAERTTATMPGVDSMVRRLPRAMALACAVAGLTAAHAMELNGQLQCGPSVQGAPAYSQSLRLTLAGDLATGQMETPDLLENQELLVASDGSARYNAIGIWKAQPARRWRIYAQGRVLGNMVELAGPMVADAATERVRPECSVRLQAPTPLPLPPARPAAYPMEPFGDDLGISPSTLNGGALFREWGLERGWTWSVRGTGNGQGRPLAARTPTAQERSLLGDLRQALTGTRVKAVVLVDAHQVVAALVRPHLQGDTLLPSASMSKTVTALGVGKALCAGRIRLDALAEGAVAALQGTPLGTASLRDLLMMSSGAGETANQHTHGFTPEETRQHLWNPESSVQALIALPRVAAAGSQRRSFEYKSTDPYLAALLVQQATGMPFTRWLQTTVFADAGLGDAHVLDTDRQGNFLATGGVRLSLDDWIRLGLYIRDQRDAAGCEGQFVRDLSTSQTRISKIPGVNGFFSGYGFLTWTDNDLVPQSAWAVGHHGQRIGWSTQRGNPRLFLTFGDGSDADMARLYPLARRWLQP